MTELEAAQEFMKNVGLPVAGLVATVHMLTRQRGSNGHPRSPLLVAGYHLDRALLDLAETRAEVRALHEELARRPPAP